MFDEWEHVLVGGVVALCDECDQPFGPAEWHTRHSAPDGADIHAACCALCESDFESWEELNDAMLD